MPTLATDLGPSTGASPALLDMQTRFVKIAANPVETLLPYVLEAIESLGCGSAVVVRGDANTDSGLQLTLPQAFMNSLIETIHTYEGTSQAHPTQVKLTEFPLNVVYSPMIKVGRQAASVKAAVDALGVLPPDMRVALIDLDQAGNGALIVSGPDKRKDFFYKYVLANLQQIAAELTANPCTFGTLGEVNSTDVRLTVNEQFAGRTVSIRVAVNGKYATADKAGHDPLIANREAAQEWEWFDVVAAGGGHIALRARANGKYVTAGDGLSPLIASQDTAVGPGVLFDVVLLTDGRYALRAVDSGKYVSADGEGKSPLIANREIAELWESFSLAII
jgi:hypothetical protein